MAHPAIHEPFSPLGASPKTKLLLLGAAGPETDLMQRARSLHIEHVSPSALKRGGISRPEDALAPLRRWFFARKPEAGFLLTGFPATLLQARVFDEWLDARGESLDAVLACDGAPAGLVAHYRDLGLLAGLPGSAVPLEAAPTA
jgi:adenylate kinase